MVGISVSTFFSISSFIQLFLTHDLPNPKPCCAAQKLNVTFVSKDSLEMKDSEACDVDQRVPSSSSHQFPRHKIDKTSSCIDE